MLLLNAWSEPLEFSIPASLLSIACRSRSTPPIRPPPGRAVDPSAAVALIGRSLVLLRGTQSAN